MNVEIGTYGILLLGKPLAAEGIEMDWVGAINNAVLPADQALVPDLCQRRPDGVGLSEPVLLLLRGPYCRGHR